MFTFARWEEVGVGVIRTFFGPLANDVIFRNLFVGIFLICGGVGFEHHSPLRGVDELLTFLNNLTHAHTQTYIYVCANVRPHSQANHQCVPGPRPKCTLFVFVFYFVIIVFAAVAVVIALSCMGWHSCRCCSAFLFIALVI